VIRRGDYTVRADTAFDAVVELCRLTRMGDEGQGSWITDEYVRVFGGLHRLGHAHSIEAWQGDQLAGGLFGVAIGQMFYGCSMFHLHPNASKVALVALSQQLAAWDFPIIDCQIHNPHLGRMGARLLPRMHFHEAVRGLVRGKRRVGSWTEHFT
jgi:leucyl/phenylalanyl-tRNA--protein transferase